MTEIRRGVPADIPGIAAIYGRILTEEEAGRASVGWIRGVYPTESDALEALEAVELPSPEAVYGKYPHQLSGGMLQRAMIAAAIVIRPKLLLLDEPTTALDVTIQAQILELLKKLNKESGVSMLFISHNLNVVRRLCGRVAVMQRGVLVEEGETDTVFHHPYTQRLIAAIPTRRGREEIP